MRKFDTNNEKHLEALRSAIYYEYELELLSQTHLMKAIGGVVFYEPQNEGKAKEKRAALDRLSLGLKTVLLDIAYDKEHGSHEGLNEKIAKIVASTFLSYDDLAMSAAVWLRERELLDPHATVSDMREFRLLVKKEAKSVARSFRIKEIAMDRRRNIKVKIEPKKNGIYFRFIFDVNE